MEVFDKRTKFVIDTINELQNGINMLKKKFVNENNPENSINEILNFFAE